MKRPRMIATAMLCLLLAGASVAAADSGGDRGDNKGDRGSQPVEKSKKQQPRGAVRGSDSRYGQGSDRHAVEARRQPSPVPRERYGDRRDVARSQPSPVPRERYGDRRDMARRQPSPVPRERWTPRARMSEHVASRTPTPAGWNNRALRGRAQFATWDEHRARRWQSEHRTWRARGGYYGYRIPDQRYQVVCGPTRRFRVDSCPLVVVGGYPRFYYGGYWVTFIDPWPEYWADDWYADDYCYIVYAGDGYYLTDVRYPSVRIAVSFTLG